jgi:hypothetical protein
LLLAKKQDEPTAEKSLDLLEAAIPPAKLLAAEKMAKQLAGEIAASGKSP